MKSKRTLSIWHYKYLSLFFISLLVAFFLFKSPYFNKFLLSVNSWDYLGIYFAGVLYVSSLTVALSMVMLSVLSQNDTNILLIGLIGGLGALTGDYIIFRFVRDKLSGEVEELIDHSKPLLHLASFFNTKYISWTLPLIGVFIIASPLPDELGVSLLGLSKMSVKKFILISFLSHTTGITLVVLTAKAVGSIF